MFPPDGGHLTKGEIKYAKKRWCIRGANIPTFSWPVAMILFDEILILMAAFARSRLLEDPLLFGGSPASLMTRLRTAAHEETELLTVLYIPFRVRTPACSALRGHGLMHGS
jgi:hypothetical protein